MMLLDVALENANVVHVQSQSQFGQQLVVAVHSAFVEDLDLWKSQCPMEAYSLDKGLFWFELGTEQHNSSFCAWTKLK